jgi:hypothetical protein
MRNLLFILEIGSDFQTRRFLNLKKYAKTKITRFKKLRTMFKPAPEEPIKFFEVSKLGSHIFLKRKNRSILVTVL